MKSFLPHILIAVNIAAIFLIFIIQPNATELHKKRLKDMRQWLLAQTPSETTTPSSASIPETAINDTVTSTTEYSYQPMEKPTRDDAVIPMEQMPPLPDPVIETPLAATPLTIQPQHPPSPAVSPAIAAILQFIKKIESIFELRVPGIRRAPVSQDIQGKKFNDDILRLIKFFSSRHP